MASFSIPDIPPKVELTPGTVDANSGKPVSPHSGTVVFSVNNSAGEIKTGKLSVIEEGDAQEAWFAIEGDQSREFGTSGGETVNIRISVPADAKPGDYSFRLLVSEEEDPDNDFEKSQSTTFTVPPAGKVGGGGGGGGSKWWLWVLIVLVVLAVVGGAVWALTRKKEEVEVPPKVEAKTATVPDLVGKKLAEAKDLSQDFDLTPVEGQPEGKEPNTIIKQVPEAGTVQNKGIPLKVTLDPGVTVPAELIGKTAGDSINILGRAKLQVTETRTVCEPSGTAGVIAKTEPAVNTKVARGSGVVVFVRVVGGVVSGRRIGCGIRVEDIRIFTPVIMGTPIPIERATLAPRIVQ